MEGTVDQCACANDSQWDEVKMVCSIKGFDVLLTSIVGTGVISVGALGNVVYIVVKKKLMGLAQLSKVAPEPTSIVM